jgi:hypothetical protein
MGDWLGTGIIATCFRTYLPFDEARAVVHSLKIKNNTEWKEFCKGQLPEKGTLPSGIPASPQQTYAKEGWKGYGDWLGTGAIAPSLREFLPFEEARAFVRSLKLKNHDEWVMFCKGQLPEKGTLPIDIPVAPSQAYSTKGWIGVGDWLGTGAVANFKKVFKPFEEARAFVQSLKLKNQDEWIMFCKGQMPKKGTLPIDIPASPNRTYAKEGWKGLGDWLGTGTIAPRQREYLPFEEARAFVHSLNIKTTSQWHKFCKGQLPEMGTLPSDIPAKPNRTYAAKGWKGMGDWLGNGRTTRNFIPID